MLSFKFDRTSSLGVFSFKIIFLIPFLVIQEWFMGAEKLTKVSQFDEKEVIDFDDNEDY